MVAGTSRHEAADGVLRTFSCALGAAPATTSASSDKQVEYGEGQFWVVEEIPCFVVAVVERLDGLEPLAVLACHLLTQGHRRVHERAEERNVAYMTTRVRVVVRADPSAQRP